MDRKECANGLQLIKVAAIRLKGNFSAVFVGALAMTTPLILFLFVGALMAILFETTWALTLGIVLFVVAVGPLQMGYIGYFNNVLSGKQPRVREVYAHIRISADTLRMVLIASLLTAMYIIGGLIWMIPAGFAISFFSMTFFFMHKFEHGRMTVAMKECATKMIGNRLAMFSYKLIFYIVYFMLFIVAGLFMVLIYTLVLENFIVCWIVSVCSALLFVFMYTFVTVYFHSSNQIFFEDVLSRDEKKRQRKVHAEANNTKQLTENQVETADKKEHPQKTESAEKSVKTEKEKAEKPTKAKKEKTEKSVKAKKTKTVKSE